MEGMAFNARFMPSIILSKEINHTGSSYKPDSLVLPHKMQGELLILWTNLSASLK